MSIATLRELELNGAPALADEAMKIANAAWANLVMRDPA